MQIVVFELGDQRFGLLGEDVREVVHAVSITPLPRAPAVVEGVIDVRGNVTAVFDIRRRFGLTAKALEPADHFILARAAGRHVAIRVDRATDLTAIEPGAVENATSVVPRSEHIVGVAKLPDGLVLIHDLAAFLSQAEEEALDRALAAAAPDGAE